MGGTDYLSAGSRDWIRMWVPLLSTPAWTETDLPSRTLIASVGSSR